MMTQRRLNLLAEALEVEGALARLTTIIIDCVLAPGELSHLTTVLGGGAAPSPKNFYFNEEGFNDDDIRAIAEMLEARAEEDSTYCRKS